MSKSRDKFLRKNQTHADTQTVSPALYYDWTMLKKC